MPTLRSIMAFWMAMAQRTASTTLRNSTRAPSPVRLNTRPFWGDGGIDEFRAQRPQPRERAVLVRARHSAEAHDVGGQYRSNLAGFAHRAPPTRLHDNTYGRTVPELRLW